MIETLKLEESEKVTEQPLPESVTWDSITDAPQSVRDLNYKDGAKLDSIDGDGNFIEDVINARFNTQSKRILDEFQFQDSGALAMKIDTDNGLWLSPTGILGKKAGVTTFAIDTGGNATFRGSIAASTITGSTITGGTIRTASSGTRVEMSDANNRLDIYSGSTRRMSLDGEALEFYNTSGVRTAVMSSTGGYSFLLDGSGSSMFGVFRYNSTYGMYFQAGTTNIAQFFNQGLAMVNNAQIRSYDIIPAGGSPYIGNASFPYGRIYVDNLYLTSSVQTSLIPGSTTSMDLGSTSRYWRTAFTRQVKFLPYSSNPETYSITYHSTAGRFRAASGTVVYNLDWTAV